MANIKFAEESYEEIARERISISREWKNREELKPAEEASCSTAMDSYRVQDERSRYAQLARDQNLRSSISRGIRVRDWRSRCAQRIRDQNLRSRISRGVRRFFCLPPTYYFYPCRDY
ncbi:uncharacterized protein LOC144754974 [Lissotriton helveticus]